MPFRLRTTIWFRPVSISFCRLSVCSASVTPARLTPSISDKKLMCERNCLVTGPVVGHQNPTRQTLVNVGASVSNGGVSRLHHEDLGEFEQQAVQGLARIHCLAQFLGGDPLSFAGDLDVGGMWRLVAAQHHRYAAHSLAANETNFDACLV